MKKAQGPPKTEEAKPKEQPEPEPKIDADEAEAEENEYENEENEEDLENEAALYSEFLGEGEEDILQQIEDMLTLHQNQDFNSFYDQHGGYDPFYLQGEDYADIGNPTVSQLIREIESIVQYAEDTISEAVDTVDEIVASAPIPQSPVENESPEPTVTVTPGPPCTCKTNKKKKSLPKKKVSIFKGDPAEFLGRQSETDFLSIMQIPEAEAIEEMDKLAGMDDVKDPLAKYEEEDEEELLHGEPRPHQQEYVSKAPRRFQRCPSIESFFRQSGHAEVHLYLRPGKKMYSREVRLDTTVLQLKQAIARYVSVPSHALDLRLKHGLLPESKTIADLGGKPGKTMKFTVEVNQRSRSEYKIRIIDDPAFYFPDEMLHEQD